MSRKPDSTKIRLSLSQYPPINMRKVILVIALFILSTKNIQAQSVSLGVYPPILQVMIQPGKSLTQVYKVYNSADPVIVSSEVLPFTGVSQTGDTELVDCSQVEVIGCESIPWFSFENANLDLGKSFFLGSDRNQEVVLKISIPDYASEGDYYNTLLFTSQAPPGSANNNTRAQASIGSNILITVSKDGNPKRTIEISEFFSKNKRFPFFDSFDLIPITLKVSNIGNAYTSVSGKVDLTGFPGLISKYTVPPQNILAQGSRILFATPSSFLTQFTLPKGFYLGKYTLQAEIENQDGQIVKRKIAFFAFPFKLSISMLAVAILYLILLLLYRKVKK